MTRGRVTLVVLFALCRTPALAQTVDDRSAHRFDVSVGALWLAGGRLGTDDANLRANRLQAAPFTIFETNSRVSSSPAFDSRLGFWLTRSIVVEAGFLYTNSTVRSRVSADVEGAEALTLEEDLEQYFIDASGVVLIDALRFGRMVPFVSGGAGYLRQLHEGRTLVETGQVFHAGAGIRHWLTLRDRGFMRAVGVRADARVYVLMNGFEFDTDPRVHGAVSASAFLTF